ncbi:hypothetical protein BDV29DRAFT_131990 [Aspergillus leporis]|uniref:Uncharacterized protein n=1 Tax=Aspergillus leporis TaxID=41062 RepID=A0A5N5X1H6_9EURO|nr:hypothetical protein BDV29DRAFT_131990 [Aspergillus leporis]
MFLLLLLIILLYYRFDTKLLKWDCWLHILNDSIYSNLHVPLVSPFKHLHLNCLPPNPRPKGPLLRRCLCRRRKLCHDTDSSTPREQPQVPMNPLPNLIVQ